MTQEECKYCRERADAGLGRCAVHVPDRPAPAPPPEPKVTVGEVTYPARRMVDISGVPETADTYRMGLDAAHEAGIPADARMTAFMSHRSASFSFTWTVGEVPR